MNMKVIASALLLILLNGVSYSQLKTAVNNRGFIGTAGFGLSFPGSKIEFPPEAGILGTSFYFTAGYLINNHFGCRLHVNYNSFADYVYRSDRQLVSGSFHVFSVSADFLAGTFNKKSPTNFYAFVGLGSHTLSQGRQGEISIRKDETSFGASLGAGFNLKLYKGLGLSWEIQYNALVGNESLNGYLTFSMLSLSYVP